MNVALAPSRSTSPDALSERPLQILFPFEGGLAGGSHMSALLLSESLDRSRFQPILLLHKDEGMLGAHLRERGVRFMLAEPAFAPLDRPSLLMRLHRRAAFLRRQNIDIVHTNEGLMHVAWGPAARLAGARMIWHHRASPQARGLNYVAPFCADRLVSVSHYSLPKSNRLVTSGRAQVIRSPFEQGPHLAAARGEAPAIRHKLKIPPQTLVVGFFGHFSARKRPLLFLEALAKARPLLDRPLLGLMFGAPYDLGSGEDVEQTIARLGLDGHVRLMGFRRPIEGWMAACDINLVTAVEEPFGRTLIEAMLIGTPVVAAASGGNLEAIRDGETGMLVRPDDANAFAHAIARMAEAGLRHRIAAQAQATAGENFGLSEHVARISRLYEELATEARSSR